MRHSPPIRSCVEADWMNNNTKLSNYWFFLMYSLKSKISLLLKIIVKFRKKAPSPKSLRRWEKKTKIRIFTSYSAFPVSQLNEKRIYEFSALLIMICYVSVLNSTYSNPLNCFIFIAFLCMHTFYPTMLDMLKRCQFLKFLYALETV